MDTEEFNLDNPSSTPASNIITREEEEIISSLITHAMPKVMVTIGSGHLGCSAASFASKMRARGVKELYILERDIEAASITRRFTSSLANLKDFVTVVFGSVSNLLEFFEARLYFSGIDFLLFSHSDNLFCEELQAFEECGFLAPDASVVACNATISKMQDYFDWVMIGGTTEEWSIAHNGVYDSQVISCGPSGGQEVGDS